MTARPGLEPVGEAEPRVHDDLLTSILKGAVDQDYVVASQHRGGDGRAGGTPTFLVAVAAFGILLGVSALQTDRAEPAQAVERAELVDQIHTRQDRLKGLHATLTSLQDEVTKRQAALARLLTSDTQLGDQVQLLAMVAATTESTGPGVTITVDDAPDAGRVASGQIRDHDLQLLVNGLWQAGAEGIAIDGHRLTSLTSIRYAGSAITVAYRSLTPPYEVEAIGDPDILPARFLETQSGKVWQSLQANFGIRFAMTTSDQVTLPAAGNVDIRYARQRTR
jgi:uncharacterized protein YlxW (UPF0749 family)